jgi:hypothetical protein
MMNGFKISRFVLRFHGTFLIALTILLIILSTIGLNLGQGPFVFLKTNPLVDVGLFQAYSLMMVIGIVILIGSFQKNTWIWDLIGLSAHISPLLANFMFYDFLSKTNLPSTIPLHGFFILLEAFAIICYYLSNYKQKTA